VLGSVTGEENYYYSYDDFVRDQQKRDSEAHAVALEMLQPNYVRWVWYHADV